ncbi:MAG: GntR family transcriptional regulator [Pseudomonadota bacterium]
MATQHTPANDEDAKPTLSKAADRAYDTIGGLILGGHFKPGDRLSEEELSRLCGVSRTPVRDALRRLAAEYFVVIRPNQGAVVAVWKRQDIEDLFHMRALLEGMAAARAASRRNDDCLIQLEQCVERIDKAVNAMPEPDIAAFLAENTAFHRTILDAADSPRLSATLASLIAPAIVARTAEHYSQADLRRSNEHHREVVEALRNRDAQLADSIMQVHIRAAANSYFSKQD